MAQTTHIHNRSNGAGTIGKLNSHQKKSSSSLPFCDNRVLLRRKINNSKRASNASLSLTW